MFGINQTVYIQVFRSEPDFSDPFRSFRLLFQRRDVTKENVFKLMSELKL